MKESRIQKTLELMKKNGLNGLLYASSANFQYLADTPEYFWQRTSMNNIAGKFSALTVAEAVFYLNDRGEGFICCIPSIKESFAGFKNLHVSYLDQMEDTISIFYKREKIGIGFNCHQFLKETLLAIDSDD
jgi:Xaa-Pro aminopeptidase